MLVKAELGRGLFESEIYSVNLSSSAAPALSNTFHGLPKADVFGVPFRVKRGLGKQIFLIAAGRPRQGPRGASLNTSKPYGEPSHTTGIDVMKNKTRTEQDSMGSVEVPASARFGAQTQRAVNNFSIGGQPMPARFIRSLGLIKAAAASANSELGALDGAIATAISEAALIIAAGDFEKGG